ncbi:MAG TPA: hypothetical protein VGJ51_01010 [Candidatus Angelobacter sp.]|jgi:hypothetical protein
MSKKSGAERQFCHRVVVINYSPFFGFFGLNELRSAFMGAIRKIEDLV